VVLCSDGLSNEVGLEELAQVLSDVPDPGEAAHRLVQAANDHGGPDNITVVVVDVLVGEADAGPSSVVTPLGARGGTPLAMAAGVAAAAARIAPHVVDVDDAPTGVVRPDPQPAGGGPPGLQTADARTSVVPRVDTLAPGAQLGFSRTGPERDAEGSGTGEFFLAATSAVPLARSSARVPVASRPEPPRPTGKESRGARRRRLGIQRRITVRVVLFILLVAAVPTAAFFAIRWYAYDNWYLAQQGNQIVIKQGYSEGILWFNPRVVKRTGVTTADILPAGLSQIRSGIQEPSEADAERYAKNLQTAYYTQRADENSASTTTVPANVGPNGSLPNITAPATTASTTTTSTVPGQTTVPATTAAAPATTAPATTAP
jgi:hypothetical protein